MFGGHIVDALSYKQMAGRAGRKGVDTEGITSLIVSHMFKPKFITEEN